MSTNNKFIKKTHCFTKRIFTLVELLIVISIIAILASMLLPALKKARDQAKKITCANNLKQLGMVFYSYADDNESFFPVASENDGLVVNNWVKSIANTYYNMEIIGADATPRPIFICPSDADVITTYRGISIPISYALNYYCKAIPLGVGGKRISSIAKPSACFISCDIKNHMYIIRGTGTLTTDSYNNPDYRHNNGLNILYVDGHMGWNKFPIQRDDDFWGPGYN